MRPATRSAKPSMTPRMSFRRSHRETCTTSGSSDVNGPAPPRTAEVEPAGAPSRRPDPGQQLSDACRGQRRVLGRGRVDGGRNDPHVPAGQLGRHERRVREHERVALVQVRPEEGPGLLGEAVGMVRPDVASPGHPHAVRRAGGSPAPPSAGRAGTPRRSCGSARPVRRRWLGARRCSAPVPGAPAHRRRRRLRAAGCAGAW